MSMYECGRCGGAVGLFCVCGPDWEPPQKPAVTTPAPSVGLLARLMQRLTLAIKKDSTC